MRLWPKTFKGVDIREVWDYRLSSAIPHIDNRGDTWVVHICAKDISDYQPGVEAKPLDSYDTGIKSEKGDQFDRKKVKACYRWLYKQRDKYALPNIEELKPLAAKANKANDALAKALEASE